MLKTVVGIGIILVFAIILKEVLLVLIPIVGFFLIGAVVLGLIQAGFVMLVSSEEENEKEEVPYTLKKSEQEK